MRASKVDTIIVNHHLQRLYYLHIHNTLIEKIFNILVYCAILFILVYVFMYFYAVDNIIYYLKKFVPAIYIILGLELLKEAAIAKNYSHFFQKHWIDLSVLTVLGSSMLFVSYIGLMKLPIFEPIKMMLEETKHYRAVKSVFTKEE